MKVHKITLTGAAIGAASLLFPLVTLKPNRVDDGTPLRWIESGAAIPLVLIALIVILLAVTSFIKESRLIVYVRNFMALAAVFLILRAAGPLAGRMIDESLPYGRISLSSGFWIMLAGMAVVCNGTMKSDRSKFTPLFVPLAVALILIAFVLSGSLDKLSISLEFSLKRDRVLSEIGNHLRLAGTAVFFSLLLGFPMGLLSAKKRKSEKPIFYFLNSVQTIPSLALFGLLIAPLSWLSFRYPFLREMGIQGVGSAPALIALTLYALLPVARNTFTGLAIVDQGALQAGRGMGMNRIQLFFSVELPMALPVILTGIRISSIQAVGNTAVAALIGAGGLGIFIFQGLGQGATDLILLGVIPLIILAVALDRILSLIIYLAISPGLRAERNFA